MHYPSNEPIIVLYHANCTDGFCSAWLLQLYFIHIDRHDVEYIPVQYNNNIPNIAGKHVLIVDFSYKPDVFETMRETALSITMLDHHSGVFEEHKHKFAFHISDVSYTSEKEADSSKCYSYKCMCLTKSGAGLTLDWITDQLTSSELDNSYFIDPLVIRVVNGVQDRDLWKFELPDTKEMKELLSSIPATFESWNNLILDSSTSAFEEEIKKAGHYLFIKNKLAEDYAAKAQAVIFDKHTHIYVVNCPANFASDVGHILAKKASFAITYVTSVDRVYVSLRSDTETGADVSAIARMYGGNGHVHAAGFSTTPEEFFKLFERIDEKLIAQTPTET